MEFVSTKLMSYPRNDCTEVSEASLVKYVAESAQKKIFLSGGCGIESHSVTQNICTAQVQLNVHAPNRI